MSRSVPPAAAPRRRLTLLDSTCIIVGIIIGASIYESTPLIADNVSGAVGLVVIWLAGGLIALVGAAAYAELATTYPREGGDYVFLTRAYGRRTGFLFAWTEYWAIRPGNIGLMAYIFARYADKLVPLDHAIESVGLQVLHRSGLGQYAFMLYACGAVAVLTAINVLGVRVGKWTQNTLTTVKVVGLIAVLIAGFALAGAAAASSGAALPNGVPPKSPDPPSLYLAMILVMFTYGGWSEMSYVAAEVRNPRRNILRAMILGTVGVTAIYVLVNLSFLSVLGLEGVRQSDAVAVDVLETGLEGLRASDAPAAGVLEWFGPAVERAVAVLVCLSCLGAINGMIFTGSRIYYAMGTEHRLFAWLGKWNGRLDTPMRSLVLQAAVALALIVGFGYDDQAFKRLLIFTTPVFWFFFLLVSLSLFVLRRKDRDTPRTYRAFWYPVTPVLFSLSCLFMLYAGIAYAWQNTGHFVEIGWSALIVVVGLAISFCDRPVDPDRR